MFPGCPLDVIKGMLGDNPSKEKAREVANELSSMNFSDENDKSNSKAAGGRSSDPGSKKPEVEQLYDPGNKGSKKKGGIMGRMMGGLKPSGLGSKRVVHQQAPEPTSSSKIPSSPQNDATSQQSLEAMLQDSVQSTRSVQAAGVSAPETMLKSLPQGLECGSEGEPTDV